MAKYSLYTPTPARTTWKIIWLRSVYKRRLKYFLLVFFLFRIFFYVIEHVFDANDGNFSPVHRPIFFLFAFYIDSNNIGCTRCAGNAPFILPKNGQSQPAEWRRKKIYDLCSAQLRQDLFHVVDKDSNTEWYFELIALTDATQSQINTYKYIYKDCSTVVAIYRKFSSIFIGISMEMIPLVAHCRRSEKQFSLFQRLQRWTTIAMAQENSRMYWTAVWCDIEKRKGIDFASRVWEVRSERKTFDFLRRYVFCWTIFTVPQNLHFISNKRWMVKHSGRYSSTTELHHPINLLCLLRNVWSRK